MNQNSSIFLCRVLPFLPLTRDLQLDRGGFGGKFLAMKAMEWRSIRLSANPLIAAESTPRNPIVSPYRDNRNSLQKDNASPNLHLRRLSVYKFSLLSPVRLSINSRVPLRWLCLLFNLLHDVPFVLPGLHNILRMTSTSECVALLVREDDTGICQSPPKFIAPHLSIDDVPDYPAGRKICNIEICRDTGGIQSARRNSKGSTQVHH